MLQRLPRLRSPHFPALWGRPQSEQAGKASSSRAPVPDSIQGQDLHPEALAFVHRPCVGSFDGDDSDDDSLAMGPGVTAPTPSTALSRPGPRADEELDLQREGEAQQLAALFKVRDKLVEVTLQNFEEVDPLSKTLGCDSENQSLESTRDRSWGPGNSERASCPQVIELDTIRNEFSALDG